MIKAAHFFQIANLMSLSRIFLMVPFVIFFYQDNFWATLITMVLIILSDIFDGHVSRKLNQVSDLGKILDPLADKIALGIGMFVILLKAGAMLWPMFVLIGRDLLIVIAGAIISKKKQEIPVSNIYGKLTSLTLSFAGLAYLIHNYFPIGIVPLILYWIATIFIFASSVSYFIKGYRLLKNQ